MKRTALIAASMVVSSWAIAQETSLTQEAQGPASIISSYNGSLQFRHYWSDIDGEEQNTYGQTRAVLGTNLFSDKVETTLILGFANDDRKDKAKMNVRTPQLVVEYKAIESDYLDINPYADIIGLRESESTSSEVGIAPNIKTGDLDIGFGSVSANAKIWAGGVFTSAKEGQPVRPGNDDARFSFAQDTAPKTREGDRGVEYRVMYNPNVAWSTPVEGLKLSVTGEWFNNYKPVKVVSTDANGVETEAKTVYEPVRNYDTYFAVAYKATDKVTVTNRVIHNTSGFDSSETKWTNLAILSYNMY
jgi:hypothetical protein